jgi:hypothetical protein
VFADNLLRRIEGSGENMLWVSTGRWELIVVSGTVVLGKSAHLENDPRSFLTFFPAALIGSSAAPGPQVNVVLTF